MSVECWQGEECTIENRNAGPPMVVVRSVNQAAMRHRCTIILVLTMMKILSGGSNPACFTRPQDVVWLRPQFFSTPPKRPAADQFPLSAAMEDAWLTAIEHIGEILDNLGRTRKFSYIVQQRTTEIFFQVKKVKTCFFRQVQSYANEPRIINPLLWLHARCGWVKMLKNS